MRKIKDDFKHLDFIFAHEPKVTDLNCLALIAKSYETAKDINSFVAEVARRRYRELEHRFKTCRQLYISEAQYYKLLRVFLRIAKNLEETFNDD